MEPCAEARDNSKHLASQVDRVAEMGDDVDRRRTKAAISAWRWISGRLALPLW
jgi:hypothetical protein